MTTYVTGIQIAHAIDGQFPDAVEDGQPEFVVVKSDSLVEVLTWLRDDPITPISFSARSPASIASSGLRSPIISSRSSIIAL